MTDTASPINIDFADQIVEVDPDLIPDIVERATDREIDMLADYMVASDEHTVILRVSKKRLKALPSDAQFDHAIGIASILGDIKGAFSIETESDLETEDILIHIVRQRHIPWCRVIPLVTHKIKEYRRL